MVTRYGMSDELGTMVYAENEGEVFLGRSVTRQTNVSEETMRKVDAEIRRIIDEQYTLARKLIEENREKVEAMTKALLEFETIDADQIKDIMSGFPPRPPKPSATPFKRKDKDDGQAGQAQPVEAAPQQPAQGTEGAE
jgi:cell division protease FtsH